MCTKAGSFSRLALLLGVVAMVMQALSLFTGSWLVVREVLAPSDPDAPDAHVRYGSVFVHTRIGLLRTCVRVEKFNSSAYPCECLPRLVLTGYLWS